MFDAEASPGDRAMARFVRINWLFVAAWVVAYFVLSAQYPSPGMAANNIIGVILLPLVYRFVHIRLRQWSRAAAIACVVLPSLGLVSTVLQPMLIGNPLAEGHSTLQVTTAFVAQYLPIPAFVLFTPGFEVAVATIFAAVFTAVWAAFAAINLLLKGEISGTFTTKYHRTTPE